MASDPRMGAAGARKVPLFISAAELAERPRRLGRIRPLARLGSVWSPRLQRDRRFVVEDILPFDGNLILVEQETGVVRTVADRQTQFRRWIRRW